MKNKINFGFLMFLFSLILINPLIYAKAEHIRIKSQQRIESEKRAEALMKSVDLSQIEDVQTRTALQAVFETLHVRQPLSNPKVTSPSNKSNEVKT